MRNYAGRIPSGSPSEVHKDLAREAFESGRSLNQLCLEAILARKALKSTIPGKISFISTGMWPSFLPESSCRS